MQVKNKNKKINILVTGVGGPAGINILKLLKKHNKNFKLFGIDINSNSAGQFMADNFSICERVTDEKKYLNWTKEFVKKNKIDVIIPTVAEELILMEKLKKVIDHKVTIFSSSQEVLELCDEKDKLYKWMSENLKEYMGAWTRLNNKKIFPAKEYFIKPVKGRGSRGCRLVSKTELNYLLKTNKKEMKDFIAMEVLPGREWTVDCYANGDGTFAYIVPRLRLGLSGGISQIGRTDQNKKVIEATRKIFTTLQNKIGNLKGPIFVQLKEDKNNLPKMVEINPRASGGLPITALSGANIADCIYSELVMSRKKIDQTWKEVTVTRYFEEKVVKTKK